MLEPELKQKLRRLKKLEKKIRSRYLGRRQNAQLVWDSYFSTKMRIPSKIPIKYPFADLLALNREQRKRVFEEFLYTVFLQHHTEEGITVNKLQDPELLSFLNLPPYATISEIKKRFRQLAHKYHPDKGGDSEKMIQLLEIYQRCFPKRKR